VSPTIKDVIARVPLFASLEATEREVLTRHLRIHRCRARGVVYMEGQPGDALFVVLSGYLKAACTGPNGRELVLCVLGPGEVFGDLSLLDGQPRPASVMALEATQLAAIGRESFLKFVDSSPKLAKALLEGMATRLRHLAKRYETVSSMAIPARLAEMLVILAQKHGQQYGTTEVCIPIRLSQQELGNMVGATRESVNKLLRQWSEQGIVRKEAGLMTIMNLSTFRDAVEQSSVDAPAQSGIGLSVRQVG
jgi:CRP-like cAMP-binding protein